MFHFWNLLRRFAFLITLLVLVRWATWTAAWEPEVMDFGATLTSLGWVALALVVVVILAGLMILCYKRVHDWGGWSITGGMTTLIVGISLGLLFIPALTTSIDIEKVFWPTLSMLAGLVLAWLTLDKYPILNRKKRKAMKLMYKDSSSSKATSATTTYRKVPPATTNPDTATDPAVATDPDESSAAPAAGPSA